MAAEFRSCLMRRGGIWKACISNLKLHSFLRRGCLQCGALANSGSVRGWWGARSRVAPRGPRRWHGETSQVMLIAEINSTHGPTHRKQFGPCPYPKLPCNLRPGSVPSEFLLLSLNAVVDCYGPAELCPASDVWTTAASSVMLWLFMRHILWAGP